VNKNEIIDRLNYLRAQELFAIQQYMNHHYRVKGQFFSEVQDIEKSIAIAEMKHAELLAEKINMLGGNPIYQPGQVTESKVSKITEGESAQEMVSADLGLEHGAIRDYTQAIKDIGDSDIGTRKLLEDILQQEEEHADSFSTWLGQEQAYDISQLGKAA
jgi:bacterioferritin